jgi:hypothetical protein
MQNGVSSHRKTTLNLSHLRIRATALQNTRMTPGLQVGPQAGGSSSWRNAFWIVHVVYWNKRLHSSHFCFGACNRSLQQWWRVDLRNSGETAWDTWSFQFLSSILVIHLIMYEQPREPVTGWRHLLKAHSLTGVGHSWWQWLGHLYSLHLSIFSVSSMGFNGFLCCNCFSMSK